MWKKNSQIIILDPLFLLTKLWMQFGLTSGTARNLIIFLNPEYTPSLFIFGKSGIMRQATVFSYEQDIQVTERNFLS